MSKSKFSTRELWEVIYGKKNEVYDYAGRLMLKSACGNDYSNYQPTIDHVRPLSAGGKDVKQNLVICHWKTNEEKGDSFPHWKVNGQRYHAKRKLGDRNGYFIVKDR